MISCVLLMQRAFIIFKLFRHFKPIKFLWGLSRRACVPRRHRKVLFLHPVSGAQGDAPLRELQTGGPLVRGQSPQAVSFSIRKL